MGNTKDNSALIQWITMIATMCATLVIFRLIGGNLFEYRVTDASGAETIVEGWSGKTWLTLCSFLFAEILSFGYGILMSHNSAQMSKTFPYQFTAIGMIVIYDFAIVILAMVALTSISLEWLSAMHTLSIVMLVIGIAAYNIGGNIVDDIETTDRQERQLAAEWKQQIASLSLMSSTLECSSSEDISKWLTSLSEELEYATSESLPGSEEVDNDISHEINELHLELESIANGNNENIDKFYNKVESLKVTIERRDKLMLTLRA